MHDAADRWCKILDDAFAKLESMSMLKPSQIAARDALKAAAEQGSDAAPPPNSISIV